MKYLRPITILFLLAVYTGLSGALGIIPVRRWRLQKWRSHLHSFFCGLGIWLIGVKTNKIGNFDSTKNYLVVSNHLSYLDILIIASHVPSCFVTSVEIRDTPVLGVITRWAGCLFVERRNKQNLGHEISELTDGLANGLNVAIFPEATSTNGEQVLRFRSPLYTSAIEAGREVLPICINYRAINGEPVTLKNRDHVYWYGDMPFFSHFMNLTSLKSVEVDLEFLPVVYKSEMNSPKEVAQYTHSLVEQRFVPCL